MCPLASSTGHGLVEVPDPVQPDDVRDRLVVAQELDVLADAAVEAERLLDGLVGPLVVQDEGEPGTRNAVCRMRAAQLVEGDLGVRREDLPVGPVADAGAGLLLRRLADDAQPRTLARSRRRSRRRRTRPGMPRRNDIVWILPSRSTSTSSREDRALTTEAPDPVQPAGGGVRPAAELAAGVQLGQHDLDAGELGLRLDVDGDAAAVVLAPRPTRPRSRRTSIRWQ